MQLHRRVWVVALFMGIAGCGGEETTAPPAIPAPKPAVTPAKPAPASPAGTDKAAAGASSAPKADHAHEAPPLEAPKTGSAPEKTEKVKLTDEQLAGIRKLPEAEQAVAIKQAACPVSGEPLGAMGKPLKVSAEGRTFYLCCDGCSDKVKSDPKAVIAKLDGK